MIWRHATGTLTLDRPRVVGIVNVTPDSFSDGGMLRTVDDARRHTDRLVGEGADIVDIGGESTRPQGATAVRVEEELRRVIPVIEAVRRDHPELPISIDTVKARVATSAVDAGASIVNDVSGLRLDADMAVACAEAKAGIVLMHSRGDVATMATFEHAHYGPDVVGEVCGELAASVDKALTAGVRRECIVIDPGIGFAKRGEDSLAVLAALRRLGNLGYPVLVGVSRKRFIGALTNAASPDDRVFGTVGANVAALERGARLFRVHDVKPNRDALDVAWTIMQQTNGS
jgi:dihydropteroate synthase